MVVDVTLTLMVVDVTLTLMVVDVTLTLMVVDVTLTLLVLDVTLTLMVVDVTLILMVVDLDVTLTPMVVDPNLTLTLMVVDVSLRNLDFSSTGMTRHIQEPISISIQNIQMFSRLEAELFQYGSSSFSKETSGLSMNCNRNILETSMIIYCLLIFSSEFHVLDLLFPGQEGYV